jgi:hypothetical protein
MIKGIKARGSCNYRRPLVMDEVEPRRQLGKERYKQKDQPVQRPEE